MATQHLYGPGDRYLNRRADTSPSPARSSSTERGGDSDRGGDELYMSSSTNTNTNTNRDMTTQTYPPPHNALNPSYSLHPNSYSHSHSPHPNNNPAPYDPSYNYVSNSNYNTASTAVLKDDFQNSNLNGMGRMGRTGRTPSPTPSEAAELARKHVVDWGKIGRWRFWIRREWTWYYVLLIIILIVVILIAVYDKQIVGWLQPTAQKIQALPAGFLIPIGIFFVISFPPLFGQEILGILCGLVWGLWPGFGIVCAGTFLGELGNFFAFKYCCRSRGEKLEREKIMYACLARIVRDGGFKIALIARYSAIPGHFTTAIFSTCGLPVLTFCAAAILSLPKQFITVYVGVALEQSGTGTESSKSKVIEDSVLGVTILVTALAMWYIFREMNKVKGAVVRERRKRRQAKLEAAGEYYPYGHTEDFNPHGSDSTLPLNPSDATHHQQWDAYGRAVGYVGDPRLEPIPGTDTRGRGRDSEIVAPLPLAPGRIPTFRTVGGGGYTSEGRRYEDPYSEPQPLNPIVDLSVGASRSPFRAPGGVVGAQESRRQESVDSVGWELEPSGVEAGAGAYRMPPIVGVGATRVNEDAERTPRNTAVGFLEQQQQQQRPVRSPFETTQDHEYIPPLAPPPGQRTPQSQVLQTRSPISPGSNNAYVPYQTTSFAQSSTSPPHAHALSSPFDNPNPNLFAAPDFSEEPLLVNPHSVLHGAGAGTGTGMRSPSSMVGTRLSSSMGGTMSPSSMVGTRSPSSMVGTRSPPSRVGTFSPPPPSYHSTAPL